MPYSEHGTGWSLKMLISEIRKGSYFTCQIGRWILVTASVQSELNCTQRDDRYDGREMICSWSAEHLQNCFVEVQSWAGVISIQSDFMQTLDREPHPVFSASVWDTGLSLWKVSNVDVKHLNDKESTTSLGRLFQWLITVTVKKVCLIRSLISASASKHWISLCLFH